MNIMDIFSTGSALLVGGFVFNIAETWYFGWNLRPQSIAEMVCDYISTGTLLVGIIMVSYAIIKAVDGATK